MANFTAVAKEKWFTKLQSHWSLPHFGSRSQNVTLFTRPFLTESEHGLGMYETSATCVKLSVLSIY